MANTFRVAEVDIIYLSYDEPNAEQNYANLCKKVPWAERVHGVLIDLLQLMVIILLTISF
jgi:hypothetical protein